MSAESSGAAQPSMNHRSPVAPARPRVPRRGREAHELLVAGVPIDEIVRRLGYSSGKVMLQAVTIFRHQNALLLDEQTKRAALDTDRARHEMLFAECVARLEAEGTKAAMAALRVLTTARALNGHDAEYVLLSSVIPVPVQDEPVEEEPEATVHEMPVRKAPPERPAPRTTAKVTPTLIKAPGAGGVGVADSALPVGPPASPPHPIAADATPSPTETSTVGGTGGVGAPEPGAP
jgi:hypothetical protein